MRNQRLANAKAKTARAKTKLDQPNQRTVFFTGTLLGLTYGAEVTGPQDGVVKWVRSAAVATIPGGGKGQADTIFTLFPERDAARGMITAAFLVYVLSRHLERVVEPQTAPSSMPNGRHRTHSFPSPT